MKTFDLGCYDIEDEYVDETYISYESQVWDCVNCNSVLFAVYSDRMGSSSSDTDSVECPICEDRSHRIYAATFPSIKVLVNGNERV